MGIVLTVLTKLKKYWWLLIPVVITFGMLVLLTDWVSKPEPKPSTEMQLF